MELIKSLNFPRISNNSYIGNAISLSSNNIAISSDEAANELDNSGVTYVYNLNSENEQKIYLTYPKENSFFGSSISLSGNRLAIGSPFLSSLSGKTGVVNIYEFINGKWEFKNKIENPINNVQNYFSQSISLYGDSIAIGSPSYENDFSGGYYSNGRVYVYDYKDGNWELSRKISPPDLGTEGGYILNENNELVFGSIQNVESKFNFGMSLSLYENKLAIGAPSEFNYHQNLGLISSGAVYIYDVLQNAPMYKISSKYPKENGLFGDNVSLHNNKLAIGATEEDGGAENSGAVYLFDLSIPYQEVNENGLISYIRSPNATLNGDFSKVSIFNNYLLIGAPKENGGKKNSGLAYLYSIENSKIATINPPVLKSDGNFGESVSLYENNFVVSDNTLFNDGQTENDFGKVHLFSFLETDFTQPGLVPYLTQVDLDNLIFNQSIDEVDKIVTILNDKLNNNLSSPEGRNVFGISSVQSIRVHPVSGYFFVCSQLNSELPLVILPPNANNENYKSEVIKNINNYGELNYPLDATWDFFNNRSWIADSGNNNVIVVDSMSKSLVKSLSGFNLPHSIIFNKNDKSVFIKSFSDKNTQKVTQINSFGDIIFELEIPGLINSIFTENVDFYELPKYFTMDFDSNRNRLWCVSKTILYMIDLDNKQITENNLAGIRLNNLSCVSVEKSSGNAFVIIDDGTNYYVQQIFKDNNLNFGLSFLRN